MSKATITTPNWVPDAVFYQIFPDRFAYSKRSPDKPAHKLNLQDWNSPPTRHGFKGGDLWGVLEKLDYLQDLGVNALYFCPVFQSAANHRYHTHDYRQVDPLLGGNEALVHSSPAAGEIEDPRSIEGQELPDGRHAQLVKGLLGPGSQAEGLNGSFAFSHRVVCEEEPRCHALTNLTPLG